MTPTQRAQQKALEMLEVKNSERNADIHLDLIELQQNFARELAALEAQELMLESLEDEEGGAA